jgi:hypothetical protein
VARDESLSLRVGPDTFAALSQLRVFVGPVDVTAWLSAPAPGELRLQPAGAPWPEGRSELVLYRVDPAQWHELARLPLQARGAGGFETSTTKPRAELQLKGRGAEGRSDGAPTSPRGRYADFAARGGLEWNGARDGWQFDAGANVQGASQRAEALRASQLGATAPKLDLADYRLQAAQGVHRIEIGHISHGNHPLLINGMASRGMNLATQLGGRVDLALNAMNGSAIVGYDNLLGMQESEHSIHALTLGTELQADRPGALRAELTLLDASLLPQTGFDTGAVPDAERSRGFGLRVLGRSRGGSLRADLAWARSRHRNPFDPLLAQGGALVDVEATTREAHRVDLQWDLLTRDTAAPAAPNATLGLMHERVAPLYRSLAAAFASDQMHTRLSLQGGWSGATLQLQAARREDNLARIATLLRTGTDEITAAFTLPLPAWLGPHEGAAADASWWPQLAGSWQQVHQRALNAPAIDTSGIAPSHRPDQQNRNAQLNLSWTHALGSFGYGLAASEQDNRQPGREQADFRNLTHQLTLAWTLHDTLRANASVQRARQHSVEQNLVRRIEGATLGLDWQARERLGFAAQASRNTQGDSADSAFTLGWTGHLQANWRIDLPGPGRPIPLQMFARYARQHDTQRDNVFGLAQSLRSWWLDVGLSVTLF